MQLDKFLLSENPIYNKNNPHYILHTEEPLIIAQVISFENISDKKILEFQQKHNIYSRLDYGFETFFFIPIKIIYSEKQILKQETADKLANIMRLMADWYEKYLIWEDSTDK